MPPAQKAKPFKIRTTKKGFEVQMVIPLQVHIEETTLQIQAQLAAVLNKLQGILDQIEVSTAEIKAAILGKLER